MSYGQKYFAKYSDYDAQEYRIEIWVKDHVGTPVEVTAGSNPVTIEKNKDVTETYLGGIIPTFYKIELLSGTNFNASTFASENYGDVLVKHYIGNTIDFQGVVAPYVSEDADLPESYYTFTLQAECGLNSLKTVNFSASDTKTRLLDIVKEATYLIPSHHFFGFKVLDNTKLFNGLTQVGNGVNFFETYIDRRTFRGMTYYEVLQNLVAVRVELFFDAGYWWLRNVSELSELYAQPALTSKLVTYDLEGNYVSQDAAYRPIKNIVRKANGFFGNLFSQKNIRINRIEPEKINYVLNGDFDKGSTNFVPNNWTAGSEGFSSVIGTNSFRFVDSVFTPDLVGDDAYIQSTAVTWEPFGAFFASPARDPQKLLFSANVLNGTGISACRMQIIASIGATAYYLSTDLAWVNETTILQKKPDSDNAIFFEIPIPPNEGITTSLNFDQPVIYNVTIRLFRAERAFQSTVAQATYFSEYNTVSLFKDSIYTSVFDEYLNAIDYRGEEKNDRENTSFLDTIIASQNSYPYRHGSLFTLGDTPIDGFSSNISGILGTIYNVYLAQSYLNVTSKRLKYYQGNSFEHFNFSDILQIDGTSYRLHSYSHSIKDKNVSFKAVELDWIGGVQIDEKLIEGNLKQVTTIINNQSLIPQDFNFVSSVNFDGRTVFGLRNAVRHESVNISEVFLRSDTGSQYAMNWDSDHNLMAVELSSNFTAKLPQDEVWAGVAAVAIAKGQTLYVSGTPGNSGKLRVSPFIANGTIPARFLVGIATENADAGDNIHVMRTGILRGLNTSAFTAGQDLWASTTQSGGLQATVPTAPNLKLSIAFVVTSHAQVGELAVRIQTGHYLADAHDTEVTGILSGQLLRYAGTRWENWTPNFLTGTAGTLNTVAKFGANNTLVNSLIFDNGTNVGIGTTSVSSSRFSISGGSQITGDNGNPYSLQFSTNVTGRRSGETVAQIGTFSNLTAIEIGAGNSGAAIYLGGNNVSGGSEFRVWTTNSERLRIRGNGNILINTTVDTGERLNVNGSLRVSTTGTILGGLTTPTIGNAAGVTANNTWTYTSNVNVPLLPTANAHAASKQYVDNLVQTGIREGMPVRTIALTNITLSGTQTISGVAVVAGNRVLVAGQTTAANNGVYIVAAGAWSRATDSDTDLELRGFNYLITEGTQANARYRNTNDSAIIVGTTAITYVIYQGAETDPIFTASPAFGITAQNILDWNVTTANWGALVPITWWNARFLDASTTNLSEGTNLYFTNTRARAALSFVAGSGGYDSVTGIITIPTNNNQISNGAGYITSSALTGYVPTSRTINGFALSENLDLTTDHVDEGRDNLYFTTARARLAITAGVGINYDALTGLISSGVFQYTDALARAAISTNATGLTYSSSTGILSLTSGFQIPTTALLNSFITENQTVTLSGDVSGTGKTSIVTTLASTGVVAGNYGNATTAATFTVDAKGRLTSATSVLITPNFANVTNKPTTVAGYGITDGITGSGTAGTIPLFSGARVIGNSIISQVGTNVGIGTASISSTRFSISGGGQINSDNGAIYSLQFSTNVVGRLSGANVAQVGTFSNFTAIEIGAGNTGAGIYMSGRNVPTTGSQLILYTDAVERIRITAAGNTLLKLTADDGQTLQVGGNARITTMAAGSSADSIVTVSSTGVLNKIDYSTFVPSTRTINGLDLSVNRVLTTSNIGEGTNLYFTNARARAALSFVAGSGAYDSTTGVITIPTNTNQLTNGAGYITSASVTEGFVPNTRTINGLDLSVNRVLTTSNIAEGTNLYYTEARVNANTNVAANTAARHAAVTISTANGLSLAGQALSLALASSTTTGALSSANWNTFNNKENAITAGTTAQYFRGDKTFQTLNTTAVTEGTNLYFTNARSRSAISLTVNTAIVAPSYNSATGVFSIPDYSKINLQQVLVNGFNSDVRMQYKEVNYATVNEIPSTPNLQQVAAVGRNSDIRLQYLGVDYATMNDIGGGGGSTPSLAQVLAVGNNAGTTPILFGDGGSIGGSGNILSLYNAATSGGILIGNNNIYLGHGGGIYVDINENLQYIQINSPILDFAWTGSVKYAFHQTPVLVPGNKYVFLWDGSKFVITNF